MNSVNKPHFRIKTQNQQQNSNYPISPTVKEIRKHLMNRNRIFDIHLNGNWFFPMSISPQKAISLLYPAYQIKEAFIANDFDYLKQNVRSIKCDVRASLISTTVTYRVNYLTTLEQENQIARRLNEIVESLQLNKLKNDFLKLKAVYDYILSSVEYDNTFENRSAYNALFNKKAVCEGCAALLYRMLSSVNIRVRIVSGKGLHESHAWNIVKIGDFWYNLDVTWDLYCKQQNRTLTDYNWFLKGERTFIDHTRDNEYDNESFNLNHTMSLEDFYN